MVYQNKFFKDLEKKITKHGGLYNAHAHIDRFATSDIIPYEGLTMIEKQNLTSRLHKDAYSKESLTQRMELFLNESIECGIKKLDSFIDIASDISLDDGLGALNIALELKEKYKDKIAFNVGAYPIFGFQKGDEKNLELFIEAAKKADFIGTLPERDDCEFYGITRNHIGFREHFRTILELAFELNKPAHFHVDQQNNPNEYGTETLIQGIRWSKYSSELIEKGKETPFIWAVHSISPSKYTKERSNHLIKNMSKCNIGLITCPSAAISMRQVSVINAPISNSIANILAILANGIPLRIGTDNVDDMFLPSTKLDLREEIGYLSNAIRFYNPSILAKIGTAKKLDTDDIRLIKEHLERDEKILSEIYQE